MPKKYKLIDRTYDTFILDLVDIKAPVIRNRRYSNKYCLSMFKFMLKDVTSWKSLSYLTDYNRHSIYHYKYLNQIFNKWVKLNIFKDAYMNMIKTNFFRLKHLKKSKNLNLFIDSTFINNLYGIEGISKNPEYNKKRVTKINVIADDFNNIIGILPDKTHLNANKKPAFSHDIKLVQKTLNNIGVQIPQIITTRIGGDKGYISNKRYRLNNGKRILIIAKKRKNQIKKNTEKEKKYLKNRYKIEISIAFIKRYNRLIIRRDKTLNNYIGFMYLALLDLFYNRNLKCT